MTFTLAGATFDPNGIFTPPGIEKTLRRYGPHTTPAHDAVARLATLLIDRALPGALSPLVAVHNNGDRGLSVTSYRATGRSPPRPPMWVSPAADPDDFVLVTERSI